MVWFIQISSFNSWLMFFSWENTIFTWSTGLLVCFCSLMGIISFHARSINMQISCHLSKVLPSSVYFLIHLYIPIWFGFQKSYDSVWIFLWGKSVFWYLSDHSVRVLLYRLLLDLSIVISGTWVQNAVKRIMQTVSAWFAVAGIFQTVSGKSGLW